LGSDGGRRSGVRLHVPAVLNSGMTPSRSPRDQWKPLVGPGKAVTPNLLARASGTTSTVIELLPRPRLPPPGRILWLMLKSVMQVVKSPEFLCLLDLPGDCDNLFVVNRSRYGLSPRACRGCSCYLLVLSWCSPLLSIIWCGSVRRWTWKMVWRFVAGISTSRRSVGVGLIARMRIFLDAERNVKGSRDLHTWR